MKQPMYPSCPPPQALSEPRTHLQQARAPQEAGLQVLVLQAEVISSSWEDVQGQSLGLAHGHVPAVQVQARGGPWRGVAIQGLVQLQHTQPQRRQAGQDRHLQAAWGPEPAPISGNDWGSGGKDPAQHCRAAAEEGHTWGPGGLAAVGSVLWGRDRAGLLLCPGSVQDGRLAQMGCGCGAPHTW